jgi:hypothetical protein
MEGLSSKSQMGRATEMSPFFFSRYLRGKSAAPLSAEPVVGYQQKDTKNFVGKNSV